MEPSQEGELKFDFGTAKYEKPDAEGKIKPQGMQLVDFIIEEEKRLILLEIKDPSQQPKSNHANAIADIERERSKFADQFKKDGWICHTLVPTARDTYTYLHLMARDNKPILYVVLLGVHLLPFDAIPLLPNFRDRLLGRLRKEMEQPWLREYVEDCLILTETTWSVAFPQYPLTRVSQAPTAS
jgi:hypothetical protein